MKKEKLEKLKKYLIGVLEIHKETVLKTQRVGGLADASLGATIRSEIRCIEYQIKLIDILLED